jgi:hypothetical protein
MASIFINGIDINELEVKWFGEGDSIQFELVRFGKNLLDSFQNRW